MSTATPPDATATGTTAAAATGTPPQGERRITAAPRLAAAARPAAATRPDAADRPAGATRPAILAAPTASACTDAAGIAAAPVTPPEKVAGGHRRMAARAPVATPLATADDRRLPFRPTHTPTQAPNRSARNQGKEIGQISAKGGKGCQGRRRGTRCPSPSGGQAHRDKGAMHQETAGQSRRKEGDEGSRTVLRGEQEPQGMGRPGRAPPRRLILQVGHDDLQHATTTSTQAQETRNASATHAADHLDARREVNSGDDTCASAVDARPTTAALSAAFHPADTFATDAHAATTLVTLENDTMFAAAFTPATPPIYGAQRGIGRQRGPRK